MILENTALISELPCGLDSGNKHLLPFTLLVLKVGGEKVVTGFPGATL
jgi:hypothetical protein